MKKLNKDVLIKLEQLYYSSNQDFTKPQLPGSIQDVPNLDDSKEYKTQIEIPAATTDSIPVSPVKKEDAFEEPEIKTKKGKNILREPPDEDAKPEDVEVFDKKGNEIDLDTLDTSELKEMISVLEDSLFEQDDPPEGEEDENDMGEMAQANMGEQNPATGEDPNIDPTQTQPDPNAMMGGTDPNAAAGMGNDPTAMGGGMEMGMGGMGEPPAKTAEEVGKIFELKKIYSRLLAIESQLSFSSEIVLLKLRKYISQSIELFETLIFNVDTFKDEIDDIIVMYYEFLEQVYDIMKRFYKIKQREEKEEEDKRGKS